MRRNLKLVWSGCFAGVMAFHLPLWKISEMSSECVDLLSPSVLFFFTLTYPPSADFLVSERLPLLYPPGFWLYRSSDPVGYFGNQFFSGLTDSLSWQTLCDRCTILRVCWLGRIESLFCFWVIYVSYRACYLSEFTWVLLLRPPAALPLVWRALTFTQMQEQRKASLLSLDRGGCVSLVVELSAPQLASLKGSKRQGLPSSLPHHMSGCRGSRQAGEPHNHLIKEGCTLHVAGLACFSPSELPFLLPTHSCLPWSSGAQALLSFAQAWSTSLGALLSPSATFFRKKHLEQCLVLRNVLHKSLLNKYMMEDEWGGTQISPRVQACFGSEWS